MRGLEERQKLLQDAIDRAKGTLSNMLTPKLPPHKSGMQMCHMCGMPVTMCVCDCISTERSGYKSKDVLKDILDAERDRIKKEIIDGLVKEVGVLLGFIIARANSILDHTDDESYINKTVAEINKLIDDFLNKER